MSDKPQFKHDSKCCQFLGRSYDGTHDLYTCREIGYRTYLARYGDEGSDYTSMPELVRGCSPHCMEAFARFAQLPLSNPNQHGSDA